MLTDSLTGAEREVDVVISCHSWKRRALLSIECVDRTRPATVSWVDEIWGKHQSLPTTQLILASRAGYSGQAIAKAKALAIPLLDYADEVPDDLDAMIIGSGGEIWVKRPAIDPGRSVVELAFQTDTAGGWKLVPPGTVLSSASGNDVMAAFDLVMEELDIPTIRAESPFTELDVVQRPTVQAEVPPDKRPLFVIDRQTNGYFEVVAFRAQVEVTISSKRVPITEATLDGIPTAWGRFGFDGVDELMVINEQPAVHPRITVTAHPGPR